MCSEYDELLEFISEETVQKLFYFKHRGGITFDGSTFVEICSTECGNNKQNRMNIHRLISRISDHLQSYATETNSIKCVWKMGSADKENLKFHGKTTLFPGKISGVN